MGMGRYNLDTAQANSINAQTAITLNNAWAQMTHEQGMIEAARRNQQITKDRSLYDQRQKQLRDNPGTREIENGDALNAAVQDLSDPRLGSSALRAANTTVPASLIAEVPFQNASERVTFMLDQLRAAKKWPKAFDEPRFAPDKRIYDDLVIRLRKEDEDGDISEKTLTEAKTLLRDLNAKLTAQPIEDEDDQKAAMKFMNSANALVGLLDKPDIRQAIVELRKVKDTSLGNLLGFMHAYNLRFGAATTLKEKQAYQQLFGILDQTRDQILSEAKLDAAPQTQVNAGNVGDIYGNFDNRRGRNTPRAPQPQNPQ